MHHRVSLVQKEHGVMTTVTVATHAQQAPFLVSVPHLVPNVLVDITHTLELECAPLVLQEKL